MPLLMLGAVNSSFADVESGKVTATGARTGVRTSNAAATNSALAGRQPRKVRLFVDRYGNLIVTSFVLEPMASGLRYEGGNGQGLLNEQALYLRSLAQAVALRNQAIRQQQWESLRRKDELDLLLEHMLKSLFVTPRPVEAVRREGKPSVDSAQEARAQEVRAREAQQRKAAQQRDAQFHYDRMRAAQQREAAKQREAAQQRGAQAQGAKKETNSAPADANSQQMSPVEEAFEDSFALLTKETKRDAYRTLKKAMVLKWHPDKVKERGGTAEEIKLAPGYFQRISDFDKAINKKPSYFKE